MELECTSVLSGWQTRIKGTNVTFGPVFNDIALLWAWQKENIYDPLKPSKGSSKPTYNDRHGGPYDRGGADSYYRRPRDPHYFKGATGQSERVSAKQMTLDEIEAYNAGYDRNEELGSFKDY